MLRSLPFKYPLSFLLHQLALALEEPHVFLKDEQTITLLSGEFLQDTELHKVIDKGSRSIGLCPDSSSLYQR